MINKYYTILLILILTSCKSINKNLPKKKTCTGEKNTIADLICKK